VKKPTRSVTNSKAISDKLNFKCDSYHEHVRLLNGRAAKAAAYLKDLVDAVIDGPEFEDARKLFSGGDATGNIHVDELHEAQDMGWRYIDDNTRETLDAGKVKRARKEGSRTFDEMGVYVYVKREIVKADKTSKIIGAIWVDIKKDSGIRSRLVAQSFAHQGERDDLFAGTPPLAATKYLISDLASKGNNGTGDYNNDFRHQKGMFHTGS